VLTDMAVEKDKTRGMRPGQESAVRRFSSAAGLIEELMTRSESFRSACEDLEVAERALAAVDSLPEPVREARRADAEVWVMRLTDEIGSMLQRVNVIPISQGKRKRKSEDS
jgi:hypothetical protein